MEEAMSGGKLSRAGKGTAAGYLASLLTIAKNLGAIPGESFGATPAGVPIPLSQQNIISPKEALQERAEMSPQIEKLRQYGETASPLGEFVGEAGGAMSVPFAGEDYLSGLGLKYGAKAVPETLARLGSAGAVRACSGS